MRYINYFMWFTTGAVFTGVYMFSISDDISKRKADILYYQTYNKVMQNFSDKLISEYDRGEKNATEDCKSGKIPSDMSKLECAILGFVPQGQFKCPKVIYIPERSNQTITP